MSYSCFRSARDSTGMFGIAMSFFASGMGAWVVYGTTEIGATPQLSWLGVLGYSIASAIPGVVVMWLGPIIKEATNGEDAFSTTDFCRMRYGRIMQVVCTAISVFYMWIYLVAELTSISNVYALIVAKEVYPDLNKVYTTGIAIILGVFTVFYTGIAGLPASIVTDKFQGIIMMILVLLLTIVVCAVPENRISREEFNLASDWTADGFYLLVTLIIAIISAELFNQATWQRVWAAKDTPSLRKGFGLGSALVFLLMMFFGIMGMIGYAKDPESYDTFEKLAYLAFFDILEPLSQGWHILVLIFITSLAASSVDSLQNGITSITSSDLLKISSNANHIKWANRVFLIVANATAIWKSSQRYDVLSLFLVADLVCSTAVFPVFLGLLDEEKWGILAPTELGAFMGFIGGVAAVLVTGTVVDSESEFNPTLYQMQPQISTSILKLTSHYFLFHLSYTKITEYATKPFEYFWLKDLDPRCTLCGTTRMWTFIITPLASLVITILFTAIDIRFRGRAPIIKFHRRNAGHKRLAEPDVNKDEDKIDLESDELEA